MTKLLVTFLTCSSFVPGTVLYATEISGRVSDPAAAPVAGAQIAAMNRLGVVARTATDSSGAFHFDLAEKSAATIVISAPGFRTVTIAPGPNLAVTLEIAPVTDSVTVTGSNLETPASQQGSSLTILSREEIEAHNEASAADLLRYIPGVAMVQNGTRGSFAELYVRGGEPTYNLVEIDGVPVNTFGGSFDFAHIPAAMLDRVEVIRGAESAVYGSYANSSVVNFITRSAEGAPHFDVLAEGGSHTERRFALTGSGTAGGFGISGFASRLDTGGPVVNGGYRNESVGLNIDRKFGSQGLFLHGNFISSENGVPGPYGSDPSHLFPGIDTVSRNRNNFSGYSAHYQADLTPRVREELFGSFFLNNNQFISPFPEAFNKDLRVQGESRTIFSISAKDTLAAGVAVGREEVRNSYVTGFSGWFLLPRTQAGIYVENRLQAARNWFINVGIRTEAIDTHAIPPGFGRPAFPAQTVVPVNPKIATVYTLRGTRLHASFGTGIRPPAAFDIAFTDNPALKPERTRSVDFGAEQSLWRDRASVGASYFYNRYYDRIVSLGGSLANLSTFKSGNLANSRAQGVEAEVRFRPIRKMAIYGNYTFLDSAVLSLTGSSFAPAYYKAGQQLLRRPRHSGSVTSSFEYHKLTANLTGYFRGEALDVEPNYGISAGLYPNPGYADAGVNLNYTLPHRLTIYANLRNILNRYYEEALGYPALKFNFVAGVRWSR